MAKKERYIDQGMPTADYLRWVKREEKYWEARMEASQVPTRPLRKKEVVLEAKRIVKVHQMDRVVRKQVIDILKKGGI